MATKAIRLTVTTSGPPGGATGTAHAGLDWGKLLGLEVIPSEGCPETINTYVDCTLPSLKRLLTLEDWNYPMPLFAYTELQRDTSGQERASPATAYPLLVGGLLVVTVTDADPGNEVTVVAVVEV